MMIVMMMTTTCRLPLHQKGHPPSRPGASFPPSALRGLHHLKKNKLNPESNHQSYTFIIPNNRTILTLHGRSRPQARKLERQPRHVHCARHMAHTDVVRPVVGPRVGQVV
jgi:hypothetical protein